MDIRKNSYRGEVSQDGTTCFEHFSPATFTLEINGVLIPLCQTCLDELNEKVKSHSTENNDGENNTAAINFEELREDMKEALKIINSDIGMKNSILVQCDTENPETKETVDAMRRSIADGESILTKYADGRLERIARTDGVGSESELTPRQSGNEKPIEASNAKAMREALANIAEYAKMAACHTEDVHLLGYLDQIERWAKAALSAPPRNCDVGTPQEQEERYHALGEVYHQPTLQDVLSWMQKSYKEGCEK